MKNRNRRRSTDKADLPSRPCQTCGRPFSWRRKWARDWDQVRYCSDRCRRARPTASRANDSDQAVDSL
ncbi:MAG: DUF2256 domain-containing protein [Natronospirillum sp.]|uniref:DUF2256 domain-containing protein n=1 Tax=Natronospirillum sp. TaxID=2812955 RepID=UPI0025F906FD|nr:DUF2256 domain-containing protein [Natronospirillum sp.]MCH8551738.1 DUF2256 domain-containing protein [Natronospirillum sp.]